MSSRPGQIANGRAYRKARGKRATVNDRDRRMSLDSGAKRTGRQDMTKLTRPHLLTGQFSK